MTEADTPKPVDVVVYATRFCPYCIRARSLLTRKGITFNEIPVGAAEGVSWSELARLSGRDTVPQIYIGTHHVGGYDDMAALERAGELDRLLGLV